MEVRPGMKHSSLRQRHKEPGATFGEQAGRETPRYYSDLAQEYRQLRSGTALTDRSSTGRIRAHGKDALDLLNRLSTNKLDELKEGRGACTVITTNKGRIVDLIMVTQRRGHLLCLTSPWRRGEVIEWIDFYTFAEDCVLEDVTEDTSMLGVHGPSSREVLAQVAPAVNCLEKYASVTVSIVDIECLAVRTDAVGMTGYDVVVARNHAGIVWNALADAGAVPVGEEAFRAVRVQHQVPWQGSELTQDYNPLEAGLKQFVSFDKGCYIGQEVVARLNTYKKVKRTLVGVRLNGEAQPGDSLLNEGKAVGIITSVASIPGENLTVGLAYVPRLIARAGSRLLVGERGVVAEICEPPPRQ